MKRTGVPILNEGEGRELLRKRCREAGIAIGTIELLIQLELQNAGKARRAGIFERINEILEAEASKNEEYDADPAQRSIFDVYTHHSTP